MVFIAVFISGKSFKSVQKLVNSKLVEISNYMMADNLIINITKTVALFISLNLRKPARDLILTFDDETIHQSNTAEYLEILPDNDLSLKSPIISLEKKIVCSKGIIAKISSKQCFAYVIIFFGTHSFTLCCITLELH